MIVVRVLFFGMLSAVFCFILGYANRHVDAEVGQLSVPLVVAGSMTLAALIVFGEQVLNALKGRRQATRKLNQLTAATRGYIESLEQSRAFTPIKVPGLHLEQGEFAVRHEDGTLGEFASARVGDGLGTRVPVGGFPIYLGGWKSVPNEELREVDTGELVLTNRRLLFIGAHTLIIPFNKLLKCRQIDAGLVISQSRSKHPHVFVLEYPALWYFLVNWAADNRFEDPKLPDGMHISVTGEPPHLRVHVTGRDK